MQKIKTIAIFLVFEMLVSYTFYLYSLRSNYVPWGSGLRDGLFFLVLFVVVLPAMLLLSVFKVFLKRQKIVLRFNYFLYSLLIIIPALGNAYSQSGLLAGMVICILIFLLNILEYLLYSQRFRFS